MSNHQEKQQSPTSSRKGKRQEKGKTGNVQKNAQSTEFIQKKD